MESGGVTSGYTSEDTDFSHHEFIDKSIAQKGEAGPYEPLSNLWQAVDMSSETRSCYITLTDLVITVVKVASISQQSFWPH